ncbi:MAG TPA: hypothetical protein VIK43_01240, partial [Cellulomonas sp.]
MTAIQGDRLPGHDVEAEVLDRVLVGRVVVREAHVLEPDRLEPLGDHGRQAEQRGHRSRERHEVARQHDDVARAHVERAGPRDPRRADEAADAEHLEGDPRERPEPPVHDVEADTGRADMRSTWTRNAA